MKRTLSAFLALMVLGTQCLFAYQPENNFWAERRKSTRRTSSTLLASLPLGAGSVRANSLTAQFPTPQKVGSTLSPSIARSVPQRFSKDHAKILSALSPAHGTIRKVSLPKDPSAYGPVVIHIQDVHMNQEAQWNIRETVTSLLHSGQVGLVALEGATEPIDLQVFVDYPHAKAVEMAADYLLKENKISGPIHAALTARGKLPKILGIDDPIHYEANVQAYRDSAPKLEKTRQEISAIQNEIEAQKRVVFSPALQSFDQQVQRYRAGKSSLDEYVRLLGRETDPDREGFAVRHFLTALDMERTLDFEQVESERARLIERLTQTLTAEETNTLVAQSLDYRTGHLRYADFYTDLSTLCEKKGIHLKSYPALDSYVKYVLLADGIDAEQLMAEIATLEKRAYARQIRTPEEQTLAARSRQAWLTGKLVDFSLSSQEWKEYDGGPRPLAKQDLDSFESFYKEAHARDIAMAQNLLQAMKKFHSLSPSPGLSHTAFLAGAVSRGRGKPLQAFPRGDEGSVTLLVTGGFHAEGMAQQLIQQRATVISYVPKISKVDAGQGPSYLSVFAWEKTPLEKLFAGNKLFLAQVPIARQDREFLGPLLVASAAVILGLILTSADFSAAYALLGGVGTVDSVSLAHGAEGVVVLAGTAFSFKLWGNGDSLTTGEVLPARQGKNGSRWVPLKALLPVNVWKIILGVTALFFGDLTVLFLGMVEKLPQKSFEQLSQEGRALVDQGNLAAGVEKFKEAVSEFIQFRNYMGRGGPLGWELSLWIKGTNTGDVFKEEAPRMAADELVKEEAIEKFLLASLSLSSGYFAKAGPQVFEPTQNVDLSPKSPFPLLSQLSRKGYLEENPLLSTASNPALYESPEGQRYVVKYLGWGSFTDSLSLKLFHLLGFSITDTRHLSEDSGLVMTPWVDGTITVEAYLRNRVVNPKFFREEAITERLFPPIFRDVLEGSKLPSMIVELTDFNLRNVLLYVDNEGNLLPKPPLFFDFERTFYFKTIAGGRGVEKKAYRRGFREIHFKVNRDTNRVFREEPIFHRNARPEHMRGVFKKLENVSQADIQRIVDDSLAEFLPAQPLTYLNTTRDELIANLWGAIQSARDLTKLDVVNRPPPDQLKKTDLINQKKVGHAASLWGAGAWEKIFGANRAKFYPLAAPFVATGAALLLTMGVWFLGGPTVAGVYARLVGAVFSLVFIASHAKALTPKRWRPKTEIPVDWGKVFVMATLYGLSITLALSGLGGVDRFGISAAVMLLLAPIISFFFFLIHGFFDGWGRVFRFKLSVPVLLATLILTPPWAISQDKSSSVASPALTIIDLVNGSEYLIRALLLGISPENKKEFELIRLPEALELIKKSGSFDGLPIPVAVIDLSNGEGMPTVLTKNMALDNHGSSMADIVHQVAGDQAEVWTLSGGFKSEAGEYNMSGIGKAVQYAVREGARVIMISLSGDGSNEAREAIKEALDKGVIVMMAVGNDGLEDTAILPSYDERILMVGSVLGNGERAPESNFGKTIEGVKVVDIFAPGRLIVTLPDGKKDLAIGTSFTPSVVGGLAVLLLSINNNLNGAEVTDVIEGTAINKSQGLPVVDFLQAVRKIIPVRRNSPEKFSPSTLAWFWRWMPYRGALHDVLHRGPRESVPPVIGMGFAMLAYVTMGASFGWVVAVALVTGFLGYSHRWGTYGFRNGRLVTMSGTVADSVMKAASWFFWITVFGGLLWGLGQVVPSDLVPSVLALGTWVGAYIGFDRHRRANREYIVNNIPDLSDSQRIIAREILKNLDGRPITLDMNQMRELVVRTAENVGRRKDNGAIDLLATSAQSSPGIKFMFVSRASLTAKGLENLRAILAGDENVFVLSDAPVPGIPEGRTVVIPFRPLPQGSKGNLPFREVLLTEVRSRIETLAPDHLLRRRSSDAVSLFHTPDLKLKGEGLAPNDPLAEAAKNPMVLLLESFRTFPFFNQTWQDSLKALLALAEFA